MSTQINSLFKIESIDQDQGTCIVRFINPYGPIETNEKTLDDFMIEEQIPTVPSGDITDEGPTVTTVKVLINENPNEDVIWSINLPINSDGSYYNKEDFLKFIAEQYPQDMFDSWNQRKQASAIDELETLVNTEHNITIQYSNPNTIVGEESI